MKQQEPSQNKSYNKKLKGFARANRNSMTKSEVWVWKFILSKKQMKGYTFKRQRPILDYIADFFCQKLDLVIEIDGITHLSEEAIKKDKKRDKDLKEIGITTLRFSSEDVLKRINVVHGVIEQWIEEQERVRSE